MDGAQTARPSVTVLIPAHNEAVSVAELVRSCLMQPYPLEAVIVVADACTDDTAQAARAAGATTVIEVDFADKAASQNAALWDITSDYVVGFDGDTVPDPMCITRMMADIAANGNDATCATILPYQPKGFFIRARRFAYALGRMWWRQCQATVGRIQVLTGACYVFRTAAIQSVGGFPNGLISADMDATWALHKAGYKLGYAGSAVAYTYDPETFSVYRSQMRRWSSGYFQNMAKYRRQLLNWRSVLVVWTALFDMGSLFVFEALLLFGLATRHWVYVETVGVWTGLHAVVTITLASRVIGIREAVLGWPCYYLVNFYNKWLYLCAFGREWILGRKYSSWTGRQGRATVITKMTRARKSGLAAIGCILAVAGGVACTSVLTRPPAPAAPAAALPPPSPGVTTGYGIIPSSRSAAKVAAFSQLAGVKAAFAEYYLPWNQAPDPAFTAQVHAQGAETIISWETDATTVRSVAAGRSDAYLRSFAAAVKAMRVPVVVALDPEFNGHWEPWGPSHATPAQFTAMWRHVHGIVTAPNVTWLWVPAPATGGNLPVSRYWPGGRYVNWTGTDAYFWGWQHHPTFASVFGPTITQLRALAPHNPVIINETGGTPGKKVLAIGQLFAGLESHQVTGFVWFDENAKAADWRIEDNPAAVTAFRRAAADYLSKEKTPDAIR